MTNYFKTLLSGIKASIEKNSKNDWNANKDEIGYIENKPFYEETKIVDINVADEGFIVEGYAYTLSEEDDAIIAQAFTDYIEAHGGDAPETISVTLDDEIYELPFNADSFTYGATIDFETLLPDFSNYPIASTIGDGSVYFTKNIYNSFGCIIDGSTVVEDSTLYSVPRLGSHSYSYISEFSNNDDRISFDNFTEILYEDLPDSITIAIDDINYTLLKGSYIIDSDEYYYYGAPAISSLGTINFDFSECPLCLDLNSAIYFSPAFENFSTVSITYNGITYLDNAYLMGNSRNLYFSSRQQFSFISQDIFNDLPNIITANIDDTVYQLPKAGYENEGEITYLAYGAPFNEDEGLIDFSNYPVSLEFRNQNGQAAWGNSACKFYEQIENISLSYSVEKTTVHQIDKKFIPVVDIQVDDYIDWDNMTSENPIQNKVIADAMDGMYVNINNKMQKGIDYVTAGQKSGTTMGSMATAEGYNTTASNQSAHAEGRNTTASGAYSHAEGYNTTASSNSTHAEGYGSTASGQYSHAEGYSTTASGQYSHTEGNNTTASGNYSHAEGDSTTASGIYSHSEGYYTTAQRRSQHVFGEYNVLDTAGTTTATKGSYIEIVGKGTSTSARSNARTLDWNGNEVLAGKLTVGVQPTNDNDVATKKYVDEHATNFISKTITIATTDWNSNVATISDSDITTNSVVFISPAPTCISDYNTAGIYCSAQGIGDLEFTCTATPSNTISINLLIL